MRGLVMVILVTLLVGCGGSTGEDDPGNTATPSIVHASPTGATTPTATVTNTAMAQVVSPTPTRQAATPTEEPDPSPTTQAAPTPIVVGSPGANLPVVGYLAATVPVGVKPMDVAVGHGSIWAQNDVDGTVSRIDPATNAVVATIPITTPIDPSNPPDVVFQRRQASPDLAIDERSVWAIAPEEQAVVQIDPETNMVAATIPLPAKAMSIAVNASSLWVALFGAASVVHIDTATGEIVATITGVPGPFGIAVAHDAVWVANNWDDSVTRIDPQTNQIIARIPLRVPGIPSGGAQCSLCAWEVMANEHGVWVSLWGVNAIARVDPGTNRLVAIIPVGTQPKTMTSDARGVWVGHDSSTGVLLIESATNQVVAAVPVPDAAHQLMRISLGENSIWAVGLSTNDVVRMELQLE